MLLPHVSRCLFCSPACGAQPIVPILASGEQERRATPIFGHRRNTRDISPQETNPPAPSVPQIKGERLWLIWGTPSLRFMVEFLHLRAFFSLPYIQMQIWAGEIPANYQGASKIPSSAAGF